MASVSSGQIVAGRGVELNTSTEEATIYYTTDGSTPTSASSVYTEPIIVSEAMTIKAYAAKAGMRDSAVVTYTYSVREAEMGLAADAAETRFIAAYEDGTFKPDQAITRYEMLEALDRVLAIEEVPASLELTDVSEEYKALVDKYIGAGIIEGHDDGTFGGEQGLTRAEFVKIMAIVLGTGESEAGSEYSDCAGHWADGWIATFTTAGYLYGNGDGTFEPDREMTRAEFTAIVNRIVGKRTTSVPPVFDDVPSSHWAYKDIMSAYLK